VRRPPMYWSAVVRSFRNSALESRVYSNLVGLKGGVNFFGNRLLYLSSPNLLANHHNPFRLYRQRLNIHNEFKMHGEIRVNFLCYPIYSTPSPLWMIRPSTATRSVKPRCTNLHGMELMGIRGRGRGMLK
jgi:hypothetical protein